jgi:hypothetical protein
VHTGYRGFVGEGQRREAADRDCGSGYSRRAHYAGIVLRISGLRDGFSIAANYDYCAHRVREKEKERDPG